MGKRLDISFISGSGKREGMNLKRMTAEVGADLAFCRGNFTDSNGSSITFSVIKTKQQAKTLASGYRTQFLFRAQVWACAKWKALCGGSSGKIYFRSAISRRSPHPCLSKSCVSQSFLFQKTDHLPAHQELSWKT